ncbi:MAG: STAS/SEC14 domain-containing protein [Alcanivorax sp.]
MTTQYIEHPAIKTIEIVVDGKVTKEEFHEISPKMEAFIEEHGKIKIIEIIKNFAGFDIAVLGEGLMFDMKHLKNFSHCAVICDGGWVGPFTRTIAPFFSVDIRTFAPHEEDVARMWLANAL